MIKKAISGGEQLRSLTLQVDWIPADNTGPINPKENSTFTEEDAKDLMMRSDESKLRFISVNDVHYTVSGLLHPL
jgi:hypothetical protein